MQPPDPSFSPVKKFRYLWRTYLRDQKSLLVPALVMGGIAAACGALGLPLIIEKVFPIVFGKEPLPAFLLNWAQAHFDEKKIQTITLWGTAAFLPALMLVKGTAQYLNTYWLNKAGLKVLESLRLRMFSRLQELPLSFHEKHKKGDLLSRLIQQTQYLQDTLLNTLNDLVLQPLTLLAGFAYLAIASWGNSHIPTLLLNILLVGACVPIVKKIGSFMVKRANQMLAGMSNITSTVQESLSAQRDIRAFGLEDLQASTLREQIRYFFQANMRVVAWRQGVTPVIEVASALALAYAFYVGSSKGIRTENFIAIGMALYFIYESLKKIGAVQNQLKLISASLDRINEIIYAEDKMPEPIHPIPLGNPKGAVAYENVTFSYDGETPVLRNINLEIPPGQIVALVGPSGSGKTTFINLLCRFYDVEEGAVKIDHTDVRDIANDELRATVGLVSQHPVLFRGSIMLNILLGRRHASDDEIRAAGKLAFVDDFLANDPEGYEKMIGEGGEGLSGGQRQRVSIARAFLKNAPILILDEATASLDMTSEEQIQASLNTLASDRTTFIIAHRFSTIRMAHRILVFDQGRIVGDGTHAELHESSPLYRDLYDKQIMNKEEGEVAHV